MKEHSKDLKVWREELRTIVHGPGRQSRHQKFLETWRRELFEGSCAGSSRVVWNKKYGRQWKIEVDILVSCTAIRSGGREEEARSVNAGEFLVFNRDRI